MAPPQRGLTPEQMNAFVEQQIVNTRILAMKQAMKLTALRCRDIPSDANIDTVIADATKLADYYIANLDGLKKKSGLVMTAQMPPPGTFKPGD